MEWNWGDTLTAIVVPALTWMVYVERRLSQLSSLKEQLDKVEAQVQKLVDHLIRSEE